MKERLFKILGTGQMPCHGGKGTWPKAGVWREVEGSLALCKNGLHLCREQDLVYWLDDEIWEAEYKGERQDGEDKIVVRKARLTHRVKTWNEKIRLLFSADCAEHVLHFFEDKYPGDNRPRLVIQAARDYANKIIDIEKLNAAGTAAGAAAWVAGTAAGTAAGYAAVYAAGAAAWVAGDAAEAAAWVAGDAAGDAAWVAGTATRAAAGAAAVYAAGAAAWVAGDAERVWQTKRLMQYLYPQERS